MDISKWEIITLIVSTLAYGSCMGISGLFRRHMICVPIIALKYSSWIALYPIYYFPIHIITALINGYVCFGFWGLILFPIAVFIAGSIWGGFTSASQTAGCGWIILSPILHSLFFVPANLVVTVINIISLF